MSRLKLLFDKVAAAMALAFLSPLILAALCATWAVDRRSPIYISERAGIQGRPFRMFKIRTMVVHVGALGQLTTSADDPRVTKLGKALRRYKIDELLQLVNVLNGDMSVVGPRPQVLPEVATYTAEEKRLLSVRPGLSDLSSIVFSDLADIVRAKDDAHLAYQQLVRPWKSRLGLFYICHSSFKLDLEIIMATLCAIVDHSVGLRLVANSLRARAAPSDLLAVAARQRPLEPTPPPGATRILGT